MKARINPTVFDKLIADHQADERPGGDADRVMDDRVDVRFHAVPRIERFNEAALRATLLRELGWLLNTTNLGAVQDLSNVPAVASSVLNYGLSGLSGSLLGREMVRSRAREMREAIVRYEPRVDRASLEVEADTESPRPNRIGFVIRGDIVEAVMAMPVEIRTDVEIDTGIASFEPD